MASFWKYLDRIHAKLERYIRSQQRRMADIQADNGAHCWDIPVLLVSLFSVFIVCFVL